MQPFELLNKVEFLRRMHSGTDTRAFVICYFISLKCFNIGSGKTDTISIAKPQEYLVLLWSKGCIIPTCVIIFFLFTVWYRLKYDTVPWCHEMTFRTHTVLYIQVTKPPYGCCTYCCSNIDCIFRTKTSCVIESLLISFFLLFLFCLFVLFYFEGGGHLAAFLYICKPIVRVFYLTLFLI